MKYDPMKCQSSCKHKIFRARNYGMTYPGGPCKVMQRANGKSQQARRWSGQFLQCPCGSGGGGRSTLNVLPQVLLHQRSLIQWRTRKDTWPLDGKEVWFSLQCVPLTQAADDTDDVSDSAAVLALAPTTAILMFQDSVCPTNIWFYCDII